jgi:hypothetical protein
VRCRAVQYDVRRDVYVMMIKLMTPCVKPVYKTAETPPFPHSHPSLNNDTKTTTQASQPTSHYGAVRGGM